ncbi:MAG: sugar phosphate nucleotidyltransferase [Gemmatimonadetes bacterium]|nr:sugar phosphate nucleotidyltransferase [Gemmatimonadota bacterium]
MATTQAVILARGLGTRMRRSDGAKLAPGQDAAAAAGAKAMMPLARPFLEYVISALADAGIGEVIVVVAPDHAAIREHFTVTAPPERVVIRFAVQEQPRGTADAVFSARDAVRNAPFLVLNADNHYSAAALRAAAGIDGNGVVAFEAEALVRESAFEPERVLRFALLDIADDDTLRAVQEKPAADAPLARAAERWVSMNLWSFTPAIFAACERVLPSVRGELELQDAVTIAIRELGLPFRVVRVREGVLDLSHRSDVAVVTERLAGVVPRT